MPRAYDSTRRRAQAEATKVAILRAAQVRFEADGYVATTMDAIATEAGVALKTVYAGFTTKAGLLRSLWDLLLKGDTDDVPVAMREAFQAVLAEPAPEQQLRLNARNAVAVKSRMGAMFGVIRSAAAVDPDAAALWELILTDFRANQGVIVASIANKGALRDGLNVERATDLLFTLNSPDVWLLLGVRLGWSADEFEQWLADASIAELLAERSSSELAGVEQVEHVGGPGPHGR